MPAEVAAIVLIAALAHASWNALVKSGDDRLVTLGVANAVRFLLCVPLVMALPLPAPASWPYLVVSAVLHVGYYAFLVAAYRFGDLSRIYPLARGLSPLMVAAGGFVFAGEKLSPVALMGVAVACAGIASLSMGGAVARPGGDPGTRMRRPSSDIADADIDAGVGPDVAADIDAGVGSDGAADIDADIDASAAAEVGVGHASGHRDRATPAHGDGEGATQAREDRRGVLFAAATALFIAAYTVTDAIGVRLSGDAVSYVAWLAILDGLPMLLVAAVSRRAALARHLATGAWRSAAGGVLQLTAYGLVVWALSLAPMAAVSALRETSVLFAAVIGVKLLGEPLGTRRVAAAALVAAGVMMIEWG